MPKKKMIIVASHEPLMDPRVDWVAHSAAERYHVTVIGFENRSRPEPPFSLVNGYSVIRIADKRIRPLVLLGFGARLFFTPKNKRAFLVAPEMLFKVLAAILMLAPLSLLMSGLAAYWVVQRLNPMRWARIGCRLALSREIHGKMRQVWRDCRSNVRKHWFQPIAHFFPRCLPHLSFVVSRFMNVIHRVTAFQWYLGHISETTSSLIEVGAQSPAPDVIYCNDLDTLLPGILLKKHFQCLLIYDAHEFWAFMNPEFQWWEQKFWLMFERALAPHVDAAYTVNHLLAAEMERLVGIHFNALPNCEPNRSNETEFKARFLVNAAPNTTTENQDLVGRTSGRVRFLFQGVFSPGRGIKEMVQAWTHVDHSRAILILRGPSGDYKDQCISLAAELSLLEHAVLFLDPVRENDLVTAAGQADIGIIPYQRLCLNSRLSCPNKTSQYMQAGLAILANNLDYVAEIVTDFDCGLIYYSDYPETFVAAVHRFLNEPSLLASCQRNAKKKALEVFNWDVQSRDLFQTCEALLKQAGKAA